MKRFLPVLIFTFLLLCSHISYAQEKAQPPVNTSPIVTADEGNKAAETAPQNKNRKAANQDERPVSINPAMDERMANIAQEANDWAMGQTIIGGIGLFFVVAATVFAGLAWLASRDAVAVTREIGEKQVRAYIGFDKAEWFFNDGHICVELSLRNFGNSPCISGKIVAEAAITIPFNEKGEEVPIMKRFFKVKADSNAFFNIIKPNGTQDVILLWKLKDVIPSHLIDAPNWPNTNIWFNFTITWVDVFGKTQKVLMRCHNFSDKKIRELVGADNIKKMQIYNTQHFDEEK